MASTRVYLLARELGVKSTAILKKCQDEGLGEINNHMATISAGLAATIREWFSEGNNLTAVETAEKVDLEKVKVKKPRGKKKKKQEEPAAETAEVETEAKVAEAEKEAEAQAPAEQEQPQAAEMPAPAEEKKAPPAKEPEPIVPAGPKLEKPEPAKLSGPKVVRIEAPEPPPPKRRPKPKQRYNIPVTEPLMAFEEEEETATKGKRPATKRPKERTHGRRRTEYDTDAAKKTHLLMQRRERDLEERRARLDAAASEGLRLRPSRKIAKKQRFEPAAAAQAGRLSRSPGTTTVQDGLAG